MDNLIKYDLYRYSGNRGIKGLIRGFKNPGFRYTFILRKLNSLNRKSLLYLFLLLLKHKYTKQYGFQIPTQTRIGYGFYIGHFGTIVINKNAVIGNNCNITHNVTIGRANRGDKKGVPTLGDKVWIGTGSVIVGKIKIGNNVLIAPNSFVNVDIPDNSLVIGSPAKIIPKENATDGYINFCLNE